MFIMAFAGVVRGKGTAKRPPTSEETLGETSEKTLGARRPGDLFEDSLPYAEKSLHNIMPPIFRCNKVHLIT